MKVFDGRKRSDSVLPHISVARSVEQIWRMSQQIESGAPKPTRVHIRFRSGANSTNSFVQRCSTVSTRETTPHHCRRKSAKPIYLNPRPSAHVGGVLVRKGGFLLPETKPLTGLQRGKCFFRGLLFLNRCGRDIVTIMPSDVDATMSIAYLLPTTRKSSLTDV